MSILGFFILERWGVLYIFFVWGKLGVFCNVFYIGERIFDCFFLYWGYYEYCTFFILGKEYFTMFFIFGKEYFTIFLYRGMVSTLRFYQ